MKTLMLLLVPLLASCKATYSAVHQKDIPSVIQKGDYVRVQTVDGEKGVYLIKAVEPDAFLVVPVVRATLGDSERMLLTDIAFLEERFVYISPITALELGATASLLAR